MSAEDTGGPVSPRSRRRPRLARDTIVGWMVLVLFVTLLTVVLVVRESLHLSVREEANADVTQEIEEFRTFTEEGRNPETGRPFTSAERLLEVYLTRQHAGSNEIIVGYVGDSGAVLPSVGPGAPEQEEYDPTRDQDFLETVGTSSSGTTDTPAGEMRWARTTVDVAGGDDAVLIVSVFTD